MGKLRDTLPLANEMKIISDNAKGDRYKEQLKELIEEIQERAAKGGRFVSITFALKYQDIVEFEAMGYIIEDGRYMFKVHTISWE